MGRDDAASTSRPPPPLRMTTIAFLAFPSSDKQASAARFGSTALVVVVVSPRKRAVCVGAASSLPRPGQQASRREGTEVKPRRVQYKYVAATEGSRELLLCHFFAKKSLFNSKTVIL